MVQIEELSQSRVHQAKQLAEARQKVQASQVKERGEMEKLEGELKTVTSELERAKEKEREVCVCILYCDIYQIITFYP